MEKINNIHWHDCELESVVEMPGRDILVLNVQYPEDWDKNIFVAKGIIFEGHHSHEVHEMPFVGNPTILDATIEAKENGFTTLRIETNAGYRLVTAKRVRISDPVSI